MEKVAKEKVRTVKDLLEEYEKIKNTPISEDITLTPETLFYMFMAYFQKLQNEN